ncbi:MAG TPA: hypothetical protein VMX76_02570 [Nevskiaceae bacterium]|nr:hypothetical protein [Nevskiaceae bacterium]
MDESELNILTRKVGKLGKAELAKIGSGKIGLSISIVTVEKLEKVEMKAISWANQFRDTTTEKANGLGKTELAKIGLGKIGLNISTVMVKRLGKVEKAGISLAKKNFSIPTGKVEGEDIALVLVIAEAEVRKEAAAKLSRQEAVAGAMAGQAQTLVEHLVEQVKGVSLLCFSLYSLLVSCLLSLVFLISMVFLISIML